MKRHITSFGVLLVGILSACPTWLKAGPLHEAAMAGDAGQVEQLLREGADINASDDVLHLMLAFRYTRSDMSVHLRLDLRNLM